MKWWRSPILHVVLGYLLAGSVWIYYSDGWLASLIPRESERALWSIYKGWLFIFITALLLTVLMWREFQRRDRIMAMLEHERRLLAAMSRVAHVGGWDFDTESGKGNWTEEVARIHDLDPTDPTSRDIGLSFFTKESRARVEAAIERAISAGEPYDLELDMISATGKSKRVRTRGEPVLSAGRVVRLQGAFQDISQQHLFQVRLATLIQAIQGLARARNLPEIMDIIRKSARRLSGADGVTIVLKEDGHCYYADEDAIGPLWKGQRFPLERCISGWAMLHREVTLIADIYADDRVPQEAYRPTFVKSLAMIPVNRHEPSGALGFYWARNHTPGPEEVELLTTLADATAIAMDNARHLERLEAEINDHKQTRAQLHLNATALKATANPVLISDRSGKIEWVNPAFTHLTGYSFQESVGQRTNLLNSGTHNAAFHSDLWNTILSGKSWHGIMVNRRKDGSEYVEEQTITPVFENQVITHFIAIKEDITDRIKQTQEVERRERYFRSLIENSHDLITLIDATGLIIFQSASVQNILGYAVADMQGRSVFDFLHPSDLEVARQGLSEALTRNILRTLLLNIRHANGSYRLLEAIGHPILWEGEWHLVINSRDQTEKNELQAQLLQAQKMESVGQLAGGIAHDFNNILTVINGTAELLLMDIVDESPLRPELETIKRAGDRAAALTRQLLVFSRRQSLQPVMANLNQICDQMHPMLERVIPENIEVRCELEAGLPDVLADHGQLEQVILNLAINARDAMPEGGVLRIQTRTLTQGEPHVELIVEDTGTGMSESIRQRAFDPFFTTKEPGKGTGLGLAMVYGIVQQSGGTIEIHSSPGEGARFRIVFPAAVARVDEKRVTEEPGSQEPAEGTILLVEDNVEVQQLTARILEKEGYRVQLVKNPEEALKITSPPDLLVTDVVMPEMSGPAMARLLRERFPDLPVLFMSGYANEDLSSLTRMDHTDFIEKPFVTEDLKSRIQNLFQRR